MFAYIYKSNIDRNDIYMSIKEDTFSIGITVFGSGLLAIIKGGERMPYAIALMVLGFIVTAYAVAAHHYPRLPKVPIWIGMLLVTWGAIGYDVYDRHTASTAQFNTDLSKFVVVSHRKFVNEVVQLDNHRYEDCTFENVTFEYDGTGFVQMNDIHISGFKQFTTYSAAVET